MTVTLLLTPIAEVACVDLRATVREALAGMQGFAAIPVVDGAGRYVGTLTEGDLLRLMHLDRDLDLDRHTVSMVPLKVANRPVDATAEIREILQAASDRNFVPVVDSRGVLMGIVTRRAVLEHLRGQAGY